MRHFHIFNIFHPVKSNREESDELTRQLKDEVSARLEKTREDIAQVEGRTETSFGQVYDTMHANDERTNVSIVTLSDSIKVKLSIFHGTYKNLC